MTGLSGSTLFRSVISSSHPFGFTLFKSMKVYSWLSLILIVWLAACSKPLPELKGVDIESWKADKYGCAGKREPFIETVRTQKNSLLALSEMQVVDILGK